MNDAERRPQIIHALRREGQDLRSGPTGEVGTVYRDSNIEVVWVRKEGETIDRNWFTAPEVDILVVVQGKLRVEFETAGCLPRILNVGDVLVLAPRMRCRAYRWPRTARGATVFLAIYPTGGRKEGRVYRRTSHRN